LDDWAQIVVGYGLSEELTTNRLQQSGASLSRQIGVAGATMMGLGSIVGTGVFVTIGLAAEVAGPAVVLAIALAALVATCNGLSSAQLAANHPLSGGTYEYGYRWLHPSLGFTAGWMFLCAKCASAATAALGCAGYLLEMIEPADAKWLVPLALAIVLLLTLLILSGIRRTNAVNIGIVSITLSSLVIFVVCGLPTALAAGMTNLTPFFAPVSAGSSRLAGLLEACALMFVAYTGYGRIATLAEEVQRPRRNIPLSIIVTLFISMSLYVAVALVAIGAVGPEKFTATGVERSAPLEIVAQEFGVPGVSQWVAVGAVTAMLGVLLNLILGLSRVVLAMARRRDMPTFLARVRGPAATPAAAVVLVGIVVSGLALIGDVKTTWSFSAFTVLMYYAITNLAAIRLHDDERLYPRAVPWAGLFACLFLAFWVEPRIWMIGLGLIAVGLLWQLTAERLARSPD
jgi:APA family basic amino acid/polyamine antiporter